jgi:hypothetical protein
MDVKPKVIKWPIYPTCRVAGLTVMAVGGFGVFRSWAWYLIA